MTNYIINPMWFYWLQVVSGAKFFFDFLAIVLVVSVIVLAITWAFCKSLYEDCPLVCEGEHKTYLGIQKVFKPIVLVTVLVWLISIFIPSKETIISMMVAKFAAYDNAQWTVDAVKSAVDYIIEAFKTIG